MFFTVGLLSGLAGGQVIKKEILADARLAASSQSVSFNLESVSTQQNPGQRGVEVSIAPGKDAYPGISIVPTSGNWNLTGFGHVETTITNLGQGALKIFLRVDNPGNWQDNPWDTETVTVQPRQTAKVTTEFGLSYGFKKGFALNPATVNNMLIFAAPSDQPQSFRIESVEAAGSPNEMPPGMVRIVPVDGLLYPVAGALHGASTQDGETPMWQLKPAEGRWDLTNFTQVNVRVKNTGPTPLTPKARIETDGGTSDWKETEKLLRPGAETVIPVEFFKPLDISASTDLTGQVTSDTVSAVDLEGGSGLEVTSVQAECKTAKLPNWVGEKPPIPGDWVKTLDDKFRGSLNRSVWSPYGPNYYDKVSHWSKNNVILGNGYAKIRYERSPGFQNDDPKQGSTPYASGYLDTYGLWTQRYGYFETRLKVPTAPGLWPAFWMMPDRGEKTGQERGAREDTANGGMEFDIMEHLSRWGPYRFNIAMHYDGYEKNHKSLGSQNNYAEPDKDGFVTFGLLWLPGLAVYYYNGKEVLRWKNARISSVPSTLMFTMPMGGWDNNALEDSKLPADLLIDYVRVWQLREFMSPSSH